MENSDFFIGEFQDFFGVSAPGNRETRTFFGNPNLFQTAPIALRGGMLKSGESWGRGESRGAGNRHSEILPQPAGRKIPGTDLQKSVTIYSKFTKSFDWKSEYNGNPGAGPPGGTKKFASSQKMRHLTRDYFIKNGYNFGWKSPKSFGE